MLFPLTLLQQNLPMVSSGLYTELFNLREIYGNIVKKKIDDIRLQYCVICVTNQEIKDPWSG